MLDPYQPVGEAMMMDQVLARSMGDYHSYFELLGIFAGITVLLAVTGIYGVMPYFLNECMRQEMPSTHSLQKSALESCSFGRLSLLPGSSHPAVARHLGRGNTGARR